MINLEDKSILLAGTKKRPIDKLSRLFNIGESRVNQSAGSLIAIDSFYIRARQLNSALVIASAGNAHANAHAR